MAEKSTIEWTEATWNPITGCTLVSDGCRHCYAARLAATRLKHHPSRKGLARLNAAGEAKFTGEVRFNEDWLDQPLRWKRPRMIFVCAHGDLFHESVPDEWIDRIFAVMALAPHHIFQVLTKRSKRMWEYVSDWELQEMLRIRLTEAGKSRDDLVWPLPNVWLGVSAEDQATADERIPHLLATPAAIRFVSAEPLLGAINLSSIEISGDEEVLPLGAGWLDRLEPGEQEGPRIDQIIVGGESGDKARPMHPDWARSIRDQCQRSGTAFFFKQWGSWLPWEPGCGPYWAAQNGRAEDHHILFPADFDNAADWDDGLWAVADGESHAAFQRMTKKNAGRLLDGVEHSEMPGLRP